LLKKNLTMDQISKQDIWFTLVNPNAGNGKGSKDWSTIAELMKRAGLSCQVIQTQAREHAIQLTREALREGFRKFVTVGGDGTLNEIVNGVFTSEGIDPRTISLGLIPVGTGNDWGKMFGISSEYEKAVAVIKEGKLLRHDIGRIDYFEGDISRTRYFINIAGLGFESVVVKRTNVQKDKGHSGKAIYFYNLLMSLLSYHNIKAEISVDGVSKTADVFSINVGNGRYCGGGMRQTPDAIPDDGLLDVTVINGIGKIEIIRNLKILYNGKILNHRKIDGYRCKNLKVHSDKILWAEADGESLGHTPAEFSIIPAAINIVYGNRLIPSV
jgi:diacylglycerol kinase (ATP)